MPSIYMYKLKVIPYENSYCTELKIVNNILIGDFNKVREILYYKNDEDFFFVNPGYKKIEKLVEKRLNIKTDIETYLMRRLKLSNKKYALNTSSSRFLIYNPKKGIMFPELEYRCRTICMIEDQKQQLWFGTVRGLYTVNLKDSTHKVIKVPISNNTGETRINDIEVCKNGFWLATLTKGLYYKSDMGTFKMSHQKLDDKALHTLHIQNDSIMWVGTNIGLHKLKYTIPNGIPQIEDIESFTTQDGLYSNFINDILGWKDNLYLATPNGIVYFNPDHLRKHAYPPKIKINEIFINGKPRKNARDSLALKHNENTIKITFTGLTLNKPIHPETFYRYKLNDESWNYTNNRSVEYNTLPSNIYSFTLQCQNNNDVWSKSAILYFNISPHFTELGIFRLALLLLTLLLIVVIVRTRTKAAQRKAEKELVYREAELATLRNQINPHFVFNSLNTLQNYIFKGNVETSNAYIGDFASLIRKSLEFSKEKEITLEQEIEFTVKYAFKSNEDIKGMILIKYLIINPETIHIEIIDNGSGFDHEKIVNQNKNHKSMGIQIIKKRIDILNEKAKNTVADFQYKSQTDGTRIVLKLPIYTL